MFVIVPLCMVFYYGLTDKSGAFTFDNILAIATAEHSKALWEALKLSVISTVICLLLAYPLAMILCNMNVNQNSFLVLIFILPMWMNFLLRTLAWQTLLEKTGDQQHPLRPASAVVKYYQYPLCHCTGYGI